MNLPASDFLRFVEAQKSIVFWDTEGSSLAGDYGSIHVVSMKPYGKAPVTFQVKHAETDHRVVVAARNWLNQSYAWVTFYGKGHDVPLLNTRLLRWGEKPLESRPHIDLYFTLKPKLKTGRKSQAHLLEFLQETMKSLGLKPEKKMTIAPNVWSDLQANFAPLIQTLVQRCESDTRGLEMLYRCTKHLIRDITR